MKLYKEENEPIPAFLLKGDTEAAPDNFTESIDLIEWSGYAFNLGKDYKAVRDSMKQIVIDLGSGDADAGFALLQTEQKDIACKYKIASDSVREAHAGINALVVYGFGYNANMFAARAARANKAVSEIANRLPMQKLIIMSESEALFSAYEKYGIEGTAYGDPVAGVGDYIEGTLRQSGYSPIGMTLDVLCDLLNEILLGDG